MSNSVALFIVVYFSVILGIAFAIYFISLFVRQSSKVRLGVVAFKQRNQLFACDHASCGRLFRRYQWDLYYAVKGKRRCPHCEQPVSVRNSTLTPSEKPPVKDKWMDSHPDCFKVNAIGYLKVRRSAKKLIELRKDDESLERFLAYDKIERPTNWVQQLTNKKGE